MLRVRFRSLTSIGCALLAGYSGRAPRRAYALAKTLKKAQHAPELAPYTQGQIKEARARLRELETRAHAEALLEHLPRASSAESATLNGSRTLISAARIWRAHIAGQSGSEEALHTESPLESEEVLGRHIT